MLQYVDTLLIGRWTVGVTETAVAGTADGAGPTSDRGGQTPSSCHSSSKTANATADYASHPAPSLSRRLWLAARLVPNARFLGTPWEVANVPPFSSNDLGWVPSRASFLLYNCATSVLCYLLLDSTRLLSGPPGQNKRLFAAERVGFFSRLGDVTAEEIGPRFVAPAVYFGTAFLFIQWVHAGLAVLTVGFASGEVRVWRPLFGGIADGWSLRRFWG